MPHIKRKAVVESYTPSKRARERQANLSNTTESKRHILIIGAGVSGILLAHHFQKFLSHAFTFKIVEKNHDVGGTWLENTYPGCACDVPSDIYQFSFAPTKDWSALFASSFEIQSYLSRVADHFGLRQYIDFNTKVGKCTWKEDKAHWLVEAVHGDVTTVEEADILINACGILNDYQFPDIPGIDAFKGTLMHTANWDHSIDLRGKNVGFIGAGASAVQVVPQIQPLVDQLSVYIRTPSWITTPPAVFNKEQIMEESDTEEYLQRCKAYEDYYNMFFPVFYRDSSTQTLKRQELAAWMEERITDEALRRELIPKYEVGCRRINPGEPFLQAIQEPNVKCIFEPIVTCEPEGLKTQAGIVDMDILIAATGFNTSFQPRFPLIGRNDVDLRDLWRDNPASYMGLGCAGFPNYISMLGPNCPVANGSLIGSLEAMADFVVRLCKRIDSLGVSTFTPDEAAQDDFNEHVEAFMVDTVWTGSCTSWYKRGYAGKVTAVWPGSSLHYREVLEQDRWEDWNWTYKSENRFSIWGPGKSTIEKTGGDHSYYLQHGPWLPSIEKVKVEGVVEPEIAT